MLPTNNVVIVSSKKKNKIITIIIMIPGIVEYSTTFHHYVCGYKHNTYTAEVRVSRNTWTDRFFTLNCV